MYQWSENQVMPLGPGILWTPTEYGYRKNVMMAGTSFAALQWLQYVQQSDLCVDSTGNRIQIEHSYHQGEKVINGYKIDGYFQKDGREYFLEYNGEFYILYDIIQHTPYYMVHITFYLRLFISSRMLCG